MVGFVDVIVLMLTSLNLCYMVLPHATDEARVTFSANSPSKIFPLVLKDHGGSIVCSKVVIIVSSDSILCLYANISDHNQYTYETNALKFLVHKTYLVICSAYCFSGEILLRASMVPKDYFSLQGSFLVGAKGTEIEMHFTKSFTSGIFGGEGFVLQVCYDNEEQKETSDRWMSAYVKR